MFNLYCVQKRGETKSYKFNIQIETNSEELTSYLNEMMDKALEEYNNDE